jgi:hypothetical protein
VNLLISKTRQTFASGCSDRDSAKELPLLSDLLWVAGTPYAQKEAFGNIKFLE